MLRYRSAVLLAALATLAATPAPHPSPKPTASPFPAFSATGTMTAKAVTKQGAGNFQMQMRVAHGTTLTRVDIVKIAVTAPDENANAMIAQMLPKGTLTILIDQAHTMMTIWSSSHPLYYQSKFSLPSPLRTPKPRPGATPSNNIMNGLGSLTQYDMFNTSLQLSGHSVVNGHMSSVFVLDSKIQKHGQKLQHTSATFALADDLSGIPVHMDVNVDADQLQATIQSDLTSIDMHPPAQTEFAIPAGYKRTSSIFMVLMDNAGTATPKPK